MKTQPEIFQNERVAASAGSGKTYALTNRFIALAAKEIDETTSLPDPTRISALTFTKKSAGEFLGKILTRLAEAASDEQKAKNLSYEIEELTFGQKKNGKYITKEKATILLKQCVKNLNRLHLSTIDSFFSSTLKAFSSETGVFSKVAMLSDAEYKAEKEKIIENILNSHSTSKKTFEIFSETIKRASFGAEEKSLKKTLKDNIDDSHNKFIEVPNPKLWGIVGKIIKEQPLEWDEQAYQAELSELKELVAGETYEEPFKWIIRFLENTNNNVVADTSSTVDYTIYKFRQGELENAFNMTYKKVAYEIPANVALLLNSLYKRICHAHILRVCDATKATAEIAMMYEKQYANDVRLAGKLTFSDVPLLLNGALATFSNIIEYRLDSRFKHWLFDEFQDTSRQQWAFFKNIIDETVLSTNGDKTFYYVGDVKQSLYSWRGGDRLLFDEIFSNYNDNAGKDNQVIFDGKELVTSWRSGEHVIKLINAVFGDRDDLLSAFGHAGSQFYHIFSTHISAETLPAAKPPKPSLAQLRLVDNAPKDSASEMQNVCEEVFKIIKETNPTSNGKTCAILVNNNKTAQTIVEYLRQRIAEEKLHIEVSGEMEKYIAYDNMISSVFAQILKFVAHPSDTASQEYIKMTPLVEFISMPDFRINTISQIASHGFKFFAEEFEKFLLSKFGKFSHQMFENIERIKEACREFDSSTPSGIDSFLEFFYEKKYRLSSQSNAIQVMTIHKSKGLGFTSVILPDLHKIRNIHDSNLKFITEEKDGSLVQQTISYLPPKAICQMNDTLYKSMEIDSDNEAFENICKLYVALTRAERALYVVFPKPSKYNPDGKIRELLMHAFEPDLQFGKLGKVVSPKEMKRIFEDVVSRRVISYGDTKWYSDKETLKQIESYTEIEVLTSPARATTFERIVPSSASGKSAQFNARKIAIGNAVHKAFEFVDTSTDSPEQKAKRAVKMAGIDENYAQEVFERLYNTLSKSEVARLFTAEKNQIIKTEFSFDTLIDNKLARGTIDRLIVKTDDNAKPISAVIVDFKSNSKYADVYNPQLEIYKTAVEKIFKISPSKIKTKIVSYADSELERVV